MDNKDKIDYISFASVMSSIAVVFLHTNGCFWQFDAIAGYWPSANLIETFFYFAVPVFFMIQGVTLIGYRKRDTTMEYFKKRFVRTVIPYMAWSIIGVLLYTKVFHTVKAEDVNLRYLINGLINGSIVSIYWFFIPLFLVYLSIPVIDIVADEKKKQIYAYVVILGFIINSLIPFLIRIFGWNLKFNYQFGIAGGYLVYVMIGYLIHNNEFDISTKSLIYIAAVGGFLVHLIGTYKVSMAAGEVLKNYKGYTSPPGIFHSVGVFLFMKDVGGHLMKRDIIRKTVIFFSAYTFPIYLIHSFVLLAIKKSGWVDMTGLLYRLVAPFGIIMFIVAITSILRVIPIVKSIV